MSFGRIAEVRHYVARHQDVNRGSDRSQASKDVQRVMLETGKWARSEEKVDRDAVRDRIATGHSGDGTGRASPQGASR
jgi:hypothetical protein